MQLERLHVGNEVNLNYQEGDMIIGLLQGIKPDEELIPIYNPVLGISYKIKGIDLMLEQLEELENRGILERVGIKSFPICPFCNTSLFKPNIVCPSCKSPSLIKSEFLVHYECNYIGEISEFQKETNIFVCPKCNRQLKRVGIDYGRPGKLYKCKKCNEINQYPLIELECTNNHIFKIDEAEMRQYPIYKVSIQRKIPFITEIYEELKTALKYFSENLTIKYLESIKIDENQIYNIPISITENNKKIKIFIDFILDEKDIDKKIINIFKTILKF